MTEGDCLGMKELTFLPLFSDESIKSVALGTNIKEELLFLSDCGLLTSSTL